VIYIQLSINLTFDIFTMTRDNETSYMLHFRSQPVPGTMNIKLLLVILIII